MGDEKEVPLWFGAMVEVKVLVEGSVVVFLDVICHVKFGCRLDNILSKRLRSEITSFRIGGFSSVYLSVLDNLYHMHYQGCW